VALERVVHREAAVIVNVETLVRVRDEAVLLATRADRVQDPPALVEQIPLHLDPAIRQDRMAFRASAVRRFPSQNQVAVHRLFLPRKNASARMPAGTATSVHGCRRTPRYICSGRFRSLTLKFERLFGSSSPPGRRSISMMSLTMRNTSGSDGSIALDPETIA